LAISREGVREAIAFPLADSARICARRQNKGDVKLSSIEDSETADYGLFSGRTANECVVLEVYRQARIPVRFDRSKMVALVNGRPVARVAYEKGARLSWNEV
jgi:hypothetical protein